MKSSRKQRTKALSDAVQRLIVLHGGLPKRISNQPRISPTGERYFGDKSLVGCPDWLAVMPLGIVLWIELKVDTDKLSDAQRAFAKELTDRGHIYIVCHDTVDELLKYLTKGKVVRGM